MTLALSNKGIVVSQHYISSLIGLKILEKGGNAFDAALAMSAALNVVLPHTGGIGGDAFILALQGDELIAYNGSGRSPRNFDVERFLNEKPKKGPLTITIPGLVDVWDYLSTNYCKFSLEELLKPSIRLCMEGFMINNELHNAILNNPSQDPDWIRIFSNLKLGDILLQKEMAENLEIISKNPRDFYEGDLAYSIVEMLSKKGCKIDYKDFEQHKGEKFEPISIDFRGWKVFELPPNTQGLTTLEILKMIEETSIDHLEYENEKRIKKYLKIASIAYEDRDLYLGDQEYMKINPYDLLKREYINERISKLNLESGDTTFLAAADKDGNIVGLIQSLFYPFGSGVVVKGITFQGRALGFAKKTGLPNSPAGNKRPLHTLSICLAEKGENKLILGCAGGDLRPQIHSQILENFISRGMDLKRAIESPRFMLINDSEFIYEKRLNLKGGKQLDFYSASVGIANAIEYDGEKFKGIADLRSEGISLALY